MSAIAQTALIVSGHLPPEVDQAAIYFPDGLVGCPNWQRFVQVVDADEDLPVAILQCLDDTGVQLLVTNPLLIEPNFRATLSKADREMLQLPNGTEPIVYCTLTAGADGSISANLLGPLVINPLTRRGRQLVLADSHYSTRHPVAGLPAEGRA